MKVVSKDTEGNEVVLFVRKPTSKDNREAKLYSNGIAAQIMLKKDEEGKPQFITRAQVRRILRDSGRLSDEDEKKISDLSAQIREMEDKLTAGGIKKSEGKKLAISLREKRNELIYCLLSINELDEHTLEAEVENANFDFLVALCTSKEDGTKFFSSIDDYKEKAETEPYAYEAADALKTIIYGTNEDIVKNNIENKFLLKYGYVNEKLQLIDSEGNLVDSDGNRVNENGEKLDDDGNVVVNRKVELGTFLDEE